MYFDTASFALSRVVCAISRIFSVWSLIFSFMALSLGCSLPNVTNAKLRCRFVDLFYLLAKLINQHTGIFAVIDGDRNQMHPTAVESTLERWDQFGRAFDLRTLCTVTLGVLDKVRIAECQAEIRKTIHGLLPADHAVRRIFK